MPHSIKESHLEEICGNCKKPHGKEINILLQHHKIYEVITCKGCGYEIIKLQNEVTFNDRHEILRDNSIGGLNR